MYDLKIVLFPEATRKMLHALFEQHDITVEVHNEPEEQYPHCLLHLPKGTSKERVGYFVQNERNKITLPDGFILYQTLDRDGWSTIRFPLEEVQP